MIFCRLGLGSAPTESIRYSKTGGAEMPRTLGTELFGNPLAVIRGNVYLFKQGGAE